MMSIQTPQSGSGEPTCTIIVPVHNGFAYTRPCIEALLAERSRATFQLLVVDNQSNDGVQDYLTGLGGRIQLLRTERNLSFAAANNRAAQAARGRYLVFLNNDTLPRPGWLDALVVAAETLADAQVVGAKLVYPLSGLIQHAGVVFSRRNEAYHIYEGFPEDHPAVNKTRQFQAVTAACMLIRRERFLELGGFDEGFVNGFEDVDLCLRVRAQGGAVWYQPLASLFHYSGMTSGRRGAEAANGRRLFQKWQGKLAADDERYFAEDGYELVVTPANNGTTRLKPVNFDSSGRLEAAKQLLRDGCLAEASRILESCHTHLPDCPDTLKYLIETLSRLGEWQRAQMMLHRLATVQPGAEALFKLAENALKLKNYPLARQLANGVVQSLSDTERLTAAAWTVMGDAAIKTGDLDDADLAYEHALSLDEGNVRALTGKATVALARNQLPAAAGLYGRALELEPHHTRALIGKGLTFVAMGERLSAIEPLYRAMQTEPGNGWVLSTLVPLLTAANRLSDAARLLDRYLDLYHDDPAMLLARAGVAFAAREYRLSRRTLDRLKRVSPAYEGVRDLEDALGRVEASLNRRETVAAAQ